MLITAFISFNVSAFVYKARHSGFYPILLFLNNMEKELRYPPLFVSITILQCGLLINYYVITCAVIGSYILIYQTEGGDKTIDMILQAVALFFVLELDNRMVHDRDYQSLQRYFNTYLEHKDKYGFNKYIKLLSGQMTIEEMEAYTKNYNDYYKNINNNSRNICTNGINQCIECCYRKQRKVFNYHTLAQMLLSTLCFFMLCLMTVGSMLAPFIVFICW